MENFVTFKPNDGLTEVIYSLPGRAGKNGGFVDLGIGPFPLEGEAVPLMGMVLNSRAARNAEFALVARLAREFGLQSPEGREVLHEILQDAKQEGVEGYTKLYEWIKANLSTYNAPKVPDPKP
jgi:hypothetical protein